MWLAFMAALLLIAAVTAALMSGCAGSTSGGASPSSGSASSPSGDSGMKMSAETAGYMNKAMPKLNKITQEWTRGNQMAAAKLWKSIGNVPGSTAADQVASKDYLTYANNVRYYMIGDGSATLKDVEDSRAKAKATLADLRP